jgi:hypothetical protein
MYGNLAIDAIPDSDANARIHPTVTFSREFINVPFNNQIGKRRNIQSVIMVMVA